MTIAARICIVLFCAVLLLDLAFTEFGKESVRFFTKPLLIPLLTGAYLSASARISSSRKLVLLAALFFSWVGDILLMWDKFFIPGLAAFLITHIFYIVYFVKAANGNSFIKKNPVWVIPVLAYLLFFLSFLTPYLGALKIPVVLYAIVISTMLLWSIGLKNCVPRPSFYSFLTGASLFVISDSLLAVNKFYEAFSFAGILIMLTYSAAQFFIATGSVIELRHRSAAARS